MTTNPIPSMLSDVEAFLKQFRTAQGAVTALALIVGIAGGAGILSTDWTVALKALLDAALGIIVLLGHQAVTTKLVKRAARRVMILQRGDDGAYRSAD